jgi:two-component system CheB/CheR fusion protein
MSKQAGRAPRLERRLDFPIVGIGASAGGLEAIELFLKNASIDSGLAYVVIQHLDPNHHSLLSELVGNVTAMRVREIADRTVVEPNCVYTIPPNKDLSILHGVLHTFDLPVPRGLHMPIDYFFRSLAEDRAETAIGVVLSGAGSDGTQGLQAIKERAGLCLVQEPSTAKFDSMPRSAIDAGLADIVAPPEELPARIVEYRLRAPLLARGDDPLGPLSQGAIDKIVILLRSRCGNDFSQYKQSTLRRRIERRMGIHGMASADAYVNFARENPQELDLLFKELLIGVTSFFRDGAAWESLSARAIRPLLEQAAGNRGLRAWSAGCSTGEEAYSLAMAIREAQDASTSPPARSVKIFATDLDKDAIDKARQGLYSAGSAAEVPAERLERFFVADGNGFRIRKEIREMVVFAPQNALMDPPFTRIDIICCRNLLIYLTPDQQKRLLPLLHYALKPGGFLFLGSAESIGSFSDLFSSLDAENRIYRRLDAPRRLDFPSASTSAPSDAAQERRPDVPSIQELADRVLLQRFAPAAVLTNSRGDIINISGSTGRFLEPAAGKANWNIMAMARPELRSRLGSAFAKALRSAEPTLARSIEIDCEGTPCFIDLAVHVLDEPEEIRGCVMVVFSVVRPPDGREGAPGRDALATELERDLLEANDELHILREGMQASQEELRSANEELQSANEELQSTVEELTTSREEMQSLNEELQTVNSELQAKIEELLAVGDDVKDLLDGTDIAMLLLDDSLRIKRFTRRAAALSKLIPADIGRVVTDISSELLYPEFVDDTKRVIRDLAVIDREIPGRDDSWLSARMMPYLPRGGAAEGVIVTFSDISRLKAVEAQLDAARRSAREADIS